MRARSLSIVVPCYNEEESITHLHERLSAACAQLNSRHPITHEIILVNDGSHDRTWFLIEKLHNKDPHVVGINLSRNHGFQPALAAGLSRAKGDRVMIIDADLQDPPELLLPMWEKMSSENAYVIYGKRLTRKGETFFKKFTAKWFYRILNWLTDVDIPVDTGDFRLMDRKVVDILNALPEQNRFMRGLVSWIGLKYLPYEYHRDERHAGVTKFNYRKMTLFAIDGITSFSVKPLRIAAFLGGILIILSILTAGFSLFAWYRGYNVPGWTSLIVTQLVVGSVQLIAIGIIGEYVGRIFLQSKGRPLFVIAEVLSQDRIARLAVEEGRA